MRASDSDALFCDFMEYYGMQDFGRSLTVDQAAALAAGLPRESRSIKGISKSKYDFDTLVLVSILDQLRVLNWKMSKDAKKKKNFPESILNELLHGDEKKEEEKEKEKIVIFSSGEEFMKRRAQLMHEEEKDG